jgi:hypothetical protein
MGDMADMAIELGLSMAYEDGLGYEDEHEGGIGNSVRYCTCNYCRTYLLRWQRTLNGWRMVNEAGEIHSCKEYRNAKRNTPDPDPDNGRDGPDPAQLGEW